MSSKEQILKQLQANLPEKTELPSLDQEWIQYDDLVAQFETVLEAVGGQLWQADSPDQAQALCNQLIEELKAEAIYSRSDRLHAGTILTDEKATPHQYANVDLAIFQGHFGVAENAAIWLNDEAMKERTVLFIAQHVLLTVPRSKLLHNMHQAYEILTWDKPQFGIFVSGPSKTADIEQSLVIGAHGARSLTVMLLNE